jgi:polysaccharide pyruvyl transferase WcaK-like protein
MKRIGIVGYYHYGNFGDDLMAIAVAHVLAARGAAPVVLTDNPGFERAGCEIQTEVDALVRSCDAIVLGGGGALLSLGPSGKVSYPGRYSDLLELVARGAAHRGVPLYAVSIGGDSPDATRRLRPGIVAFLGSPTFQRATVRLREDLACLERLGAEASYFPDLVLSVPAILPEVRREGSGIPGRLGLQSVSRRLVRRIAHLARRGIVPPPLMIFASHAELGGKARAVSDAYGIESYQAHDVLHAARTIGGLQAFIGSRLHIGLLAAAGGIPFYVADAQRKVERFFDDLNIVRPEVPTGIFAAGAIPAALQRYRDWPDSESLRNAVAASAGHIRFLERCADA